MNRFVNRVVLLCSLVVCTAMLSGCWNRTEVNDLALVTGAAIDKKEGDYIELSVQVYIPRTGGGQQGMGAQGGGGGGGGVKTLVRSAKGTTVAEAMSKLQELLPRKIFWGHTDIFVIGERMAKQGIRDLIDFIMRFPQPRERAAVFVTKGDAKKTLGFHPPLERTSSEVLREMAKSKLSIDVDVKKLCQMLSGDAQAAALPWVEMLPLEFEHNQNQTIPYIRGTAVFRKDKLAGELDDETTRGLLWVRDEIVKEAVITITPKDSPGYISFNLDSSSTKLVPQIKNGVWSITVKIETNENMIQNATPLDIMVPAINASLEQQLQEEIRGRVEKALTQTKVLKTDVFGFAEAFHRKYPKEWNRVKDQWDVRFPELDVKIDAKATIRRPGSTTTGGNRPEDEVKK